MAQPSRIPEEDRSGVRPTNIPELRSRERNATRNRGEHTGSGKPGTRAGRGRRRGHHSGAASQGSTRSRGDHSDGFYRPDELKGSEENPEGGYFNQNGDRGRFFRRGRTNNKAPGLVRRHKTIFTLVSVIVTSSVAFAIFFFSGIFNLPNIMKNIEQAGFQRYQVDMNGRSSKWLEAYMELRFGEIEDPNLKPQDRDNVFFRAARVDNNKPMTDWYRTLRASSFEQDLFEQKGIRFTSIAEKRGNSIVYRTGVISFKDTDRRITFDPGQQTFDALQRGEPSAFNGVLRDFVNVDQKFETDKEARTAIKGIVHERYPQWWKAIKRWHVRQDIQNMIGVRKWTFFEEKRNKAREKRIDIRNKIINQALPEDSKSGAFIKCLFGTSECKTSSDPADPDANDYTATRPRDPDKTNGDPDNPQSVGDGSGEDTLKSGADAAGVAGETTKKILSKLIARAGLLSVLDSLSRFDESVQDGSLSKFVTQAKAHQAVGVFTVFAVAGDQLTTGQVSPTEVNAFMKEFARPTSSEGWTTTIDPGKKTGVNSPKKKEFCSAGHQSWMEKHPAKAEREFQYSCPQSSVGGPNRAQELEDAWNNGPGLVLHPFLAAFHKATGGIFDVFNAVAGAVIDPVVSATLSATGTDDNVEDVVAYVGTKALEFGGGVMPLNDKTPSGQVANIGIQGSSVMGEASMRDQGGIATTTQSAATTQKNMIAYQADQQNFSSFFDRYMSLSNPKSLASTQLLAVTSSGLAGFGQNLASVFSSALSGPFKALSQPVHAAVPDGYAACNFTGIQCMDMPDVCLNSQPLNMTPQSSTNADEMGIFNPDELNWSLMTSKKDWYEALYDKVDGDEGRALKVYNCALFDNTVRSGMSARYGYKGVNALLSQSEPGQESDAAGGSVTVSGDAQQVAQEILNNSNVTYAFSAGDDVKLAAQGKPGTNGAPIDIRLLQIVAALAKHHKVVVTAFESYGQGHSTGSDHYSGHAVDIDTIDGSEAFQTITDYWDIIKDYSDGATFLQGDCPGAKSPPKGMNRLNGDACNHQHISVGPS